MKKKYFIGLIVILGLMTSCSVTVHDHDVIVEEPIVTLDEVLNDYELWYIDINETVGTGDVPFIQNAFTMSFVNGEVFVNNNIVGIGDNGYGFGRRLGYYDTFDMDLEVDDSASLWNFQVTQINADKIELYHYGTDTSFFLYGYQRSNFDYDLLFYDNIHYFLQEYEAWEKIDTVGGEENIFDNENFLNFPLESTDRFLSSIDKVNTPISLLQWDFEGAYEVFDVQNDEYTKVLTLNYEGNESESFDLTVSNDETIVLSHRTSGTTYTFRGRQMIVLEKENKSEEIQKDTRKRKIIKNRFFELGL